MANERNEWQALGRAKNNNVKQILRKKGGGFTKDRDAAAAGNAHLMTKAEAQDAVKWGKGHDVTVYATQSPYPFIVLDNDTSWGNKDLSEKLNALGKKQMRYIWVGEYDRTPHRQWELRMAYLNGRGNLAARCCSKYRGQHSWDNCGKDSQSNHSHGNAADASVLHSGRGGAYTNLGNWGHGIRENMRDLRLALTVPGEAWHTEIGTRWAA